MRCHGRDGGQDPARDPAETAPNSVLIAMPLGSGVAITHLGNVPPHSFRVPVVDDGKQPELAIQYGRDLRCVGAPHLDWRRGDNAAVRGLRLVVPGGGAGDSRPFSRINRNTCLR